MALKKFTKNDPEFEIFQEVYRIYQNHYLPEDNDAFWDDLRHCGMALGEKYNTPLVVDLFVAISKDIERRFKNDKTRNGNHAGKI